MAWVICPSAHQRTACISSAKTFSFFMAACLMRSSASFRLLRIPALKIPQFLELALLLLFGRP
jgi:hypothetical protein